MISKHLKNLIRDVTPPVILRVLRSARPAPPFAESEIAPPSYGFSGNYSSFGEAARDSTGYDTTTVAETVVPTLARAIASFKIPAQIDSRMQQMHSVFAMMAGSDRRKFRVLDIGGAGGAYYFYLRALAPHIDLDWTILELPSMVAAVRAIDRCPIKYVDDVSRTEDRYDITLASGSLQYFEDPVIGIRTCFAKGEHVILSRMPLHGGEQDVIRLQKVSPTIHAASMPVWIFSRSRLHALLETLGTTKLQWTIPADEPFWQLAGAESMHGYLIKSFAKT